MRALYDTMKVSSILVIGGCGDYFEVADTVVMMDCYVPKVRCRGWFAWNWLNGVLVATSVGGVGGVGWCQEGLSTCPLPLFSSCPSACKYVARQRRRPPKSVSYTHLTLPTKA